MIVVVRYSAPILLAVEVDELGYALALASSGKPARIDVGGAFVIIIVEGGESVAGGIIVLRLQIAQLMPPVVLIAGNENTAASIRFQVSRVVVLVIRAA